MRSHYTLHRLYLDAALQAGTELDMAADHVNYLGRVLRKRVGDTLRVFNGRDGEWLAEIVSAERRAMRVRVVERLREPQDGPDITLYIATLRKHRMATVLEKATELGVKTIQPIITQRTQFTALNMDRAKAQIIEAAEQTERVDIPDIHPPIAFETVVERQSDDRPLIFADEAGGASRISDVVASLALPIGLLIGPEGGFHPDERDSLRASPNVRPVTLGPRILRADTAAISLLALVQASIGDW